MTLATDLERKLESALAVQLKTHQLLRRMRVRHNSEESPKVNLDLILVAKRGVQSPPFSGVFEMEVTINLSMKYGKTVETLPAFLAKLKAIEEVITRPGLDNETFGWPIGIFAAKLSLSVADFHCYEFAVTAKDDTPQDQKHNCIWTASAVCAPQSYALVTPAYIRNEKTNQPILDEETNQPILAE